MTNLEKKMLRYRLMEKHRELARGSNDDLLVAKRLLHFLMRGEIRLGLGDADWEVENILEQNGVHLSYTGRGYSAYARVIWER